MDEYIELNATVSIIKEQQKSLCPMGLYSRNAVYGTDRERFDAWQEIIDKIEAIPAADVAPVIHGRWGDDGTGIIICSECGNGYNLIERYTRYCPNCGAKMDLQEEQQ